MIQIAVCSDDFQACSQLEDYIRRRKEGRRLEVEIFNTGKEPEGALKERHYDLIFLDIVVRDRSGVELGRFIREELGNGVSMIVYMSTYGDEYAPDLFQFRPFHFLRRPIKSEDFQNVFYEAYKKIEDDAGIFGPKSSRTVYGIPLRDILYFEGDNRRVKVVTVDHAYHCYSTLEDLFSKINIEQAGFVRLHRSYTVNLRYAAAFSVHVMALLDDSESTVNTLFKENALRRYGGYISKTGMGPGSKSGEQKKRNRHINTRQMPEGNRTPSDACLSWTVGDGLRKFRRFP